MSNEMAEQLKERTMRFALRIMRLCRTLPADWAGRFIAGQLSGPAPEQAPTITLRAERGRTRHFVNKLGMVVEESDESVFWLMFVGRSGLNETAEQRDVLAEARELLAIFIQSAKTASANNNPQ